jgi:hypothetical protein
MATNARKAELREKMLAIRQELNELAIRAGDLRWEYDVLNHEIGLIEFHENRAVVRDSDG